MNRLYFGDNLQWLSDRKEFPDESVDLVYLDPPFNSNADYNVLFRELSGQVSQAQFHAFTDTWSWADAADTYHQFIASSNQPAAFICTAIRQRVITCELRWMKSSTRRIFATRLSGNAAAAMQISSKECAAAGAYTTCCCYMRRATRQFGILCLHRMTKIMWNRCIDSSMTKDGGIARVI